MQPSQGHQDRLSFVELFDRMHHYHRQSTPTVLYGIFRFIQDVTTRVTAFTNDDWAVVMQESCDSIRNSLHPSSITGMNVATIEVATAAVAFCILFDDISDLHEVRQNAHFIVSMASCAGSLDRRQISIISTWLSGLAEFWLSFEALRLNEEFASEAEESMTNALEDLGDKYTPVHDWLVWLLQNPETEDCYTVIRGDVVAVLHAPHEQLN